jgi:uncharacterized protein
VSHPGRYRAPVSVSAPQPLVRPLRQFVVKLHSRCNLACDYCYVYRHADQGWRAQPTVMADATIDVLASRIGEHVRRHALPRVALTLHGGEPLLAGPHRVARLVTAVRAALPSGARAEVTVQTNGTLVDDAFLALAHRHGIGVGVSVDGGRAAHDRHRRFADGRPSFDLVAAALRRLATDQHRDVYAGLLCTVDLSNDPVATYEELLRFAPPQLDLLLPHGNWSAPPPGLPAGATPYADWLIAVFDRWYGAPRRETGIRLFESLISVLLGGPSRSEALGMTSPDAVTVETDGSMEGSDALKSTAPGLATTGLTVTDHTFDEAAAHPVIAAARRTPEVLAAACRRCPVAAVCGGGLHAHRFAGPARPTRLIGHTSPDLRLGFSNASVYCADLYRLIRHVRGRIAADLDATTTG